MKKLAFAGLLATTFAISAFGQVKPGLTNNHVTSISAGAVGLRTATRARVIGRELKATNAAEVKNSTQELGNQPPNSGASLARAAAPQVASRNPTAATTSIPAGANFVPAAATQLYRVGVGDVLDIQISQNRAKQSTLFTVMEGGLVDFPLIDAPVEVAGLTTVEVAERLRQRIRVFNNPIVAVKVRDYASHGVTINGFVAAPGVKTLRREAVPLYVVLSEALPLPEAVQATIIRKGRAPLNVKLSDVAATASLIIPGDVIRVTAEPLAALEFFFAGGEVNAPGQKIFHSGLTLTQAILASGGLSRNATSIVRISRQGTDGKLVTVEHNLASIQNGKVSDPTLLKGDRVEVRAK